jgi:hypothetical protein
MKITIALGNAADTGGPTKYALNLRTQWEALGHEVRLVSYAPWMWRLPSGVRHLCYTVSLMSAARTADIFVGFDTMTVGAPLALASKLSRVPYIIRIGGDFVWEQYVERTGNLVKLSRFYTEARAKWSGKERLEVWLTGLVARNAAAMMFNSAWQKNMWCRVYGISAASACVVENYFPTRSEGLPPVQKNFVAAGRAIKLKQEDMLKRVFARIQQTHPDVVLDVASMPNDQHQARVAGCYAVVLGSISDVSPNVIIDAVKYGKPFVCTNDTGIKDRLQGTGLFVDTSDEHAFEAAVVSLLNPDSYAHTAGQVQAFSFVRTWEDVANDVITIITQVCTS